MTGSDRSRQVNPPWQRHGSGDVPGYRLVDPDRQTAEFFRRGRTGKHKAAAPGKDGVYHSKVLPGPWLRLDWLWQRPLPSIIDALTAWGVT